MVVGRLFSHRTSQLGDLDLLLGQVALNAGKKHLALPRLEAVHQRGDGAHIIRIAEQDQFTIDELVVGDVLCVLGVQVQLWHTHKDGKKKRDRRDGIVKCYWALKKKKKRLQDSQ